MGRGDIVKNSICASLSKRKDYYELVLRIPEDEFFSVYSELNEKSAGAVIDEYKSEYSDDGIPEIQEYTTNEGSSSVIIKARMYYIGNDHTDAYKTTHLFNKGNDQ